jgi:predicted transcriptional regulator/transcriptional regulator with XRE-family HTH domain
MATTIVGLKIRETRRALGVSQSELARQMGISPAYLNLIEFSKRRIGGKLLKKAADCLNLSPSDLDGALELRLVNELREIAADPELRASDVNADSIEAFIGRYPEWASALALLYRNDRSNRELATALSDRLTHDPYLGDIVHQMLTYISAIRSTAEILDEIKDIPPPQRQRFHSALASESHRLTDVAQALAGYFDKAHSTGRSVTPVEEIETFLLANANRFPQIDDAADELRREIFPDGILRDVDMIAALERRGREVVRESRPDDGDAVSIPLDTPPASAIARLAKAVVESFLTDPIEAVLAAQPADTGSVTRQYMAGILTTYAVDALLLPAGAFRDSAARARYDVEALARTWGTRFERICRRLTAVCGHDTESPRFAYLSCNAAGSTLDRRPVVDLSFPRHGSACPLWAIYRSFTTPEAVARQVAAFPDGRKVLFVARARRTGPIGFDRPDIYVADMLAIDADQAGDTVYGDGLDFGTRGRAEPVGTNCRICPRSGCLHRTDDPLVGRLQD